MAKGKKAQPSAAIFDGRTMQFTPECGERAGYDEYKRKKGSKVHIAVDTLGYLLAVKVTPANEQERAKVMELAVEVQEVTQQSMRWVVEYSFAWAARFRHLARDFERTLEVLAGFHLMNQFQDFLCNYQECDLKSSFLNPYVKDFQPHCAAG